MPSVVLVQALGVEVNVVYRGVDDADLYGAQRVRFREGGICGLKVLKALGEVSWNIGLRDGMYRDKLVNYYGFHVRNMAG